MRVGTDVSIQCCIEEGYMMADYNSRKLYKRGELQPGHEVRFLAHLPGYLKSEMGWQVGDLSLLVDIDLSANDLWELYTENEETKQGIDSMIGMEHKFPESIYDMLHLASDINSYCGLDDTTSYHLFNMLSHK